MGLKFKGLVPFGNNFEVNISAPLDTRTVVEKYEYLLSKDTFTSLVYEGMIVSVSGDNKNDGVYRLVKINGNTLEWKRLGDLTNSYYPESSVSDSLALSSLGAYNMYSYLLGKITTLEGSISTNETILAMQAEITALQNRCTELESLLEWKDTVSPVPPTPVQTEEPVQGLIEEAEAIQDEINVATYAVRRLNNRVSFNNPEPNVVSTTTATPYTTRMPVKQDIYTIMENMDNTIVTLENEYNTLENKFTFNTDNKVTSTTTQIKLRTISKVENKSTNIKDQIEHKQNIIASLTDKLESLLNKISFN